MASPFKRSDMCNNHDFYQCGKVKLKIAPLFGLVLPRRM